MENLTDELDIASELENMEREQAIYNIIKNIPKGRDIEALLKEDLKCIECDEIIPLQRQKIVLSLHHTCNYCIECQMMIDKENKMYGG